MRSCRFSCREIFASSAAIRDFGSSLLVVIGRGSSRQFSWSARFIVELVKSGDDGGRLVRWPSVSQWFLRTSLA